VAISFIGLYVSIVFTPKHHHQPPPSLTSICLFRLRIMTWAYWPAPMQKSIRYATSLIALLPSFQRMPFHFSFKITTEPWRACASSTTRCSAAWNEPIGPHVTLAILRRLYLRLQALLTQLPPTLKRMTQLLCNKTAWSRFIC